MRSRTEIAPEDAIWPVPEGSLMPGLPDRLDITALALAAVESDVMALIEGAPVKAHGDHPVYVHDLADALDRLEWIIDKAKEIQAEVASNLARAIPFGTPRIAFPGLRPLTPHWGGERKAWANDLLQEKVKPRLLTDPETGERRTPEGVLDATLSVVSLNGTNAKVTGLRALGIDPDDYCKKEPKPPTVQVTKDALDR